MQRGQTNTLYGIGVAVAAVVIGFLLVLGSGAQVGYGNVGVVSYWGAIDLQQQPLNPGFHMVLPVATHIESVSTQPQNHTFREVAAASKELQNVYVDGGINYQILPNQAAQLTTNGGPDTIIQRVLDPAFQDYIKEVVPQYPAACDGTDPKCINILQARAPIREQVLKSLQLKADPYGITVKDVFITNIHFDKTYTDAIEAAAVSQQKLAQAKIDAQAKVAAAQGDADSQVTRAKADRDSNVLREQGLTPELIQYLQVQNQTQAIAKWNGALPTTELGGSTSIILTK